MARRLRLQLSIAQQPAEVDGTPPVVEPVPVPVVELVPDPAVEFVVKPGLAVEPGMDGVWLLPAVGLFAALPVVPGVVVVPCVVVPGAVPLAIEPHGRPIASVRPLLFNELVVDGLVPVVPAVDGFDGEGEVVDVPVDPLVPAEPLIPAEPLPVPDDAPALPAAPPEAPPLAPPPAPAARATPALPARRIAAINDIE